MKKLLIILTFIPWLLYYFSETKNNLKIIKNNSEDEHYLKNNFFYIIPIDNLILYGILVYFSHFHKDSASIFFVRVILFSAINMYLFFNTISKKDYKLIFENNSEKVPIKYLSITLIPLLIYLFTKKQMITYYIMISLNIIDYFIIKILGLPKDEKNIQYWTYNW